MTMTRTIEAIRPSPPQHWVGDGFPVRSLLSPQEGRASRQSPFLLLDYAGPAAFEPSDEPRGVDTHPHRGFETVTIVYQGELEHRDSAGNSGSIAQGDVQWMTAAAGVLHEEKHSRAFTRRGGVLEMVQLWVNLPAKHKMAPPRYQALQADAIPVVPLDEGAGTARLIAGELHGTPGAAETVTPVLLWDLRVREGGEVRLPVPEGFTLAVLVRRGGLAAGEGRRIEAGALATFDRAGTELVLRADAESEALVLGGEPIDEPMAAYGPFVMNTVDELQTAIDDVRSGRLGQIAD